MEIGTFRFFSTVFLFFSKPGSADSSAGDSTVLL